MTVLTNTEMGVLVVIVIFVVGSLMSAFFDSEEFL